MLETRDEDARSPLNDAVQVKQFYPAPTPLGAMLVATAALISIPNACTGVIFQAETDRC